MIEPFFLENQSFWLNDYLATFAGTRLIGLNIYSFSVKIHLSLIKVPEKKNISWMLSCCRLRSLK